jgi:DNA-binding CsgD family transcriptional regulator
VAKKGEVLNICIADTLDHAERRGISRAMLVEGLALASADLRRRKSRSSWDDFATMITRLEIAVGGPAEFEAFMVDEIVALPAFRVLGSLVLSPKRIYAIFWEHTARQLFGHVGLSGREMADGRLEFVYEIPPNYQGCIALGNGTRGTMRALPTLLGLPEALVESDLSPRHGVFRITVPPSHTLVARAARTLDAPLATLLRLGSGSSNVTGTSLIDTFDLFFDESTIVENAREDGQWLVRQSGLQAVWRELALLMKKRCFCERLALWVQQDGQGGPVHVGSTEAPPHGTTCSRPLTVGGRLVGRIDADLISSGVAEGTVPYFEALVPWLAVGVDRCLQTGANTVATDLELRVERAKKYLKLTPREGQVLDLVVGGCVNKEIAAALGVSVKTVEFMMTRTLRKAGVDNRARLMTRVLANDWTEFEA